MGGGCLIAMYHYVRDVEATPFPAIRALPTAAFEQQLDWLERRYRIVTIDDLDAALAGGAPLPPAAALLTFDDGFVDHYATVWPILRRRGLTGVFFLSRHASGSAPRMLGVHKTHFLLAHLGSDAFGDAVLRECGIARAAGAGPAAVFGTDRWEHTDERAIKDLLNYELPFDVADRVLDTLFATHLGAQDAFARGLYLSEAMVAEMAAGGMAFGYHTRSHRMLSRLSPDEQAGELMDGVAWIRGLTGQARTSFCYPWGGPGTYTAETLRLLEQAGYSMAFNTVRRRFDAARDGRFELPRLDTRDLPPYAADEPAATPAPATESA